MVRSDGGSGGVLSGSLAASGPTGPEPERTDTETDFEHRETSTDMATPLTIEPFEGEDWTGLRVEGEVDLATADRLEVAVTEALDTGGSQFVLDLTDVGFMDSTGIRVVVLAHRAAQERGGELLVVTGDGPVRRVFEVAGLGSTLTLHRTLGDLPS
jgi:anti-anti-sigma factor